jgi:PPK2 family polyphosphate:nucleotide phosphotransferase
MAHSLARKLSPGKAVHLNDYATDEDGGLNKEQGQAALVPLLEELHDLQELMWGAQTHALLVVLQGRDAAGKDGIMNHVISAINPQGVLTTAFKVPTEDEAAHDFLWRVHKATPAKGVVGVYNRSHYEQVLVVRVHKFAPHDQIEAAYDQINAYEQLLADTGTIVVKCYLHLSEKEQRERLLARETDVTKSWKLNPGDWAERPFWDDYTRAYEDALRRCNTPSTPWYIIPADRKWAAHLAVAQVLVETLRPYRQGWLDDLAALQKKMVGELAAVEKK